MNPVSYPRGKPTLTNNTNASGVTNRQLSQKTEAESRFSSMLAGRGNSVSPHVLSSPINNVSLNGYDSMFGIERLYNKKIVTNASFKTQLTTKEETKLDNDKSACDYNGNIRDEGSFTESTKQNVLISTNDCRVKEDYIDTKDYLKALPNKNAIYKLDNDKSARDVNGNELVTKIDVKSICKQLFTTDTKSRQNKNKNHPRYLVNDKDKSLDGNKTTTNNSSFLTKPNQTDNMNKHCSSHNKANNIDFKPSGQHLEVNTDESTSLYGLHQQIYHPSNPQKQQDSDELCQYLSLTPSDSRIGDWNYPFSTEEWESDSSSKLKKSPYLLFVVTPEHFENAMRRVEIETCELKHTNYFQNDIRMYLYIPVIKGGFINRQDRKDQR